MKTTQTMRRLKRGSSLMTAIAVIAMVAALIAVAFMIGRQMNSDGGSTNDQTATPAGQTDNQVDAGENGNSDAGQRSGNNNDSATNQQQNAGPKPPPIRLNPAQIDLGRMGPNQVRSGTTKLINTSNQELRVINTRSSCTCTAVEMPNQVIPPNGSVDVGAQYTSSSLFGNKSTSITVLFADYDPITVNVVAEVALAVYATPGYVQAAGAQKSGTYVLQSVDDQAFEVLAIDGRDPQFVNHNPDTDEPKSQYTIKWDVSDVDPRSCEYSDGHPLRAWWVVETTHPDCPVMDIHVRHQCTKRDRPSRAQGWMPAERRKLIGEVMAGETREIEIGLNWYPNRQPMDVVTKVTSESPELFDATLVGSTGAGENLRYTIRLTINEDHRGLIYGRIRLHGQRYSSGLLICGRAAPPGVSSGG